MKKSAVLAALFVLTATACGSQADPASSSPPSSAAAPVDAERAEWCESFQRIENSSQGESKSQALADATNPSLTPAAREAGMRRYLELMDVPLNSQTDAQCSGAVWERFYAETKARVEASTSAGATPVN